MPQQNFRPSASAGGRRRFGYVRELDELLGEDGIVLSPTITSPGWLAEGRMTAGDQAGPLPGEVFNTSVQNTTGHPALSLPTGRGRSPAHGSATICCQTSRAPGNGPIPGPGRPAATSLSTPASRDNNPAYVLDTQVAPALQLPITR